MRHAWPGTDRCLTGSRWKAVRTSSASSPTASTPCSRGWKRTSPNNSDSRPTRPTSSAPHWRSRRHCWTLPATTRTATPATCLTGFTPSTPGPSTSARRCCCSAAPTSGHSHAKPSTCPSWRKKPTETLLPLAEKRGLTIEASGDATPTIGSHALLLQLSTNLLHNAIVHNLPEHGTVWISTSAQPSSAALTVENTGEQLTPQVVATLAEPFQRGTERVRSDHAGVGLGLAIAQSIAQAHNGTLDLAPRAAGGLSVTVRLPAASPR